jgi:hypothetical protein
MRPEYRDPCKLLLLLQHLEQRGRDARKALLGIAENYLNVINDGSQLPSWRTK